MAKKILFTITILMLFVFLVGCTENPPQTGGSGQVINLDDSGSTFAGMDNIVDANNQFAFDIYGELKSDKGNIFFSPYSISSALTMVYEGAKGETAEQMSSTLHLPEDKSSLRSDFAAIYNDINSQSDQYQLSTANALWGQEGFAFNPDYIDVVEGFYGGKLTNLDFKTDTENSRQTINTWVEDQTNDKIKDLIPAGMLNSMTRLVLTNAVYFKGDWQKEFDKKKTQDRTFRAPSGEKQVPTMEMTGSESRFLYTENDDLQALEMGYKGGNVSMLILLPKSDDISIIESYLNPENLSEIRSDMKYTQRVDVYLPKFKFENKMMMKGILEDLGMPLAFSADADFSGMTTEQKLAISDVIHQSYVDVDEEGTEAAAATAIIMKVTSAEPMPMQIPVFRADHPFIFIIQQKDTGNILFMGRVNNPSGG